MKKQGKKSNLSNRSEDVNFQQFESLKTINREQSQTITDLKQLLNQTLNVKLKYEKII